MTLLSLQEATKLVGISGWTLTGPQERFLMRSVTEFVEKHGEDWVKENRLKLQEDLQLALAELGPPVQTRAKK